jgi:hypothetical protein
MKQQPISDRRPLARPRAQRVSNAPVSPDRKRLMNRRQRRRRNEGLRGVSVRTSLYIKYACYWLSIVLAGAITHYCFKSVPEASSGGIWLMASCAFQLVVATLGTWFAAHRRKEIVEQLKAYVFGYTVAPGLGVAVFMWVARNMVSSGSEDLFIRTAVSALPWIYFIPVLIPAVIFLKMVAGFKTIDKIGLDDEEILQIYTRNDGLQR